PRGTPPSPPGRPRDQEEEEEEEEEGGGGAPVPPPRAPAQGLQYRLGSRRCRRCLITFPDAAFAARHAKRQHPRDFAAAALRGALFVCFVCARPFGSSAALLRHQRGHHARPPGAPPPPPRPSPPAPPAPPPLACTECGRAFAREGALHRHYIRHRARRALRGAARPRGAAPDNKKGGRAAAAERFCARVTSRRRRERAVTPGDVAAPTMTSPLPAMTSPLPPVTSPP
ncbi:LOW QUALITY PROTEIN: zinc finger protein 576-like, partial [Aphelocoma coerulescens]|uniref:LOW QUALITY PROTEIN: zinc finger protein 576-like n=1 Tax=Aphelocoma coerulescens TaxID=39617 RepID=UPI00360442FE